jgi:hypothetical protein
MYDKSLNLPCMDDLYHVYALVCIVNVVAFFVPGYLWPIGSRIYNVWLSLNMAIVIAHVIWIYQVGSKLSFDEQHLYHVIATAFIISWLVVHFLATLLAGAVVAVAGILTCEYEGKTLIDLMGFFVFLAFLVVVVLFGSYILASYLTSNKLTHKALELVDAVLVGVIAVGSLRFLAYQQPIDTWPRPFANYEPASVCCPTIPGTDAFSSDCPLYATTPICIEAILAILFRLYYDHHLASRSRGTTAASATTSGRASLVPHSRLSSLKAKDKMSSDYLPLIPLHSNSKETHEQQSDFDL